MQGSGSRCILLLCLCHIREGYSSSKYSNAILDDRGIFFGQTQHTRTQKQSASQTPRWSSRKPSLPPYFGPRHFEP